MGLMIRVYSQNHGEEQRNHTQLMDLRTQNGNGSMYQRKQLLHNITTTTIINIEILEMKVSLKKFTDSHLMIRASFLNHGGELRKPIHKMDSRTQLGNGLIRNHLLKRKAISKILVIKRSQNMFKVLQPGMLTSSQNHMPDTKMHHQPTVDKTQDSNISEYDLITVRNRDFI